MYIEALEIKNFRNLAEIKLTPGEGINLICGDNAQGKTNMVEAIYLLTGQRSFRMGKESDLVRFGEKEAEISVRFFSGGRSQTAELRIGGKKTAALAEIPVQPSELTGVFLAVVFSPTELALIKEGPSERRAFLDGAISQVIPRYMTTMSALSRATMQRNSLLYDISKGFGDIDQLEIWDRSFARLAYSVINARSRFLARLMPHAASIFGEIGAEELSGEYSCTVPPPEGESWGECGKESGEAAIISALRGCRGEDIKNAATTVGPHRDDIELKINGVSARLFGSQGQQRSCALALKLAQCAVMEETLGEKPIILLDDVLSELDKSRRDFLLKGRHSGQIFITACGASAARAVCAGRVIRLKSGRITSDKARVQK